MKKLLVALGVLAVVAPFMAQGAEVGFNGQNYSLNKGQVLNQNLYAVGRITSVMGDVQGDAVLAGGTVNVPGNVSGDLAVAGGTVFVSGNVGGGIYAAGGNVDISGNVGKSLRVAGGTVTVSGTVNGDLLVGGGQIYLMPNAVIKGDLILGGGMADIEGKVSGNIKSSARQVTIDNEVGGTVDLNVETLSLGPQAVLAQGLTYHSYTEAAIDPAAKVNGPLNFDKKTAAPAPKAGNWLAAVLGIGLLFKFLMLLAAALVFAYFFKKSTALAVRGGMSSWKNLWRGFAFLVLTPIVAIILLVTVIGIPLGFLVLIAYVLTIFLAFVFAIITAGAWLLKWIWKKDVLDWKTVLLGVVVWMILGFIPILGGLAKFLLVLASLGVVSHNLLQAWSRENA